IVAVLTSRILALRHLLFPLWTYLSGFGREKEFWWLPVVRILFQHSEIKRHGWAEGTGGTERAQTLSLISFPSVL
ncbi:MAG: hypothetical protein Q9214_001072, partial [Letrouitia sp. 1 TL-2023]